MNQRAEELKARTAAFARTVIALCEKVPDKLITRRIVQQLIDAATSVAANYRAACRARSRAEFIAKMGVVLEEADESHGWLQLLVDTNAVHRGEALNLINEADELTAIFAASCRTAKKGGRANPNRPILKSSITE